MTKSKEEEIIGCLWLICGFTALSAGCSKHTVALLLAIGMIDQIRSICFAVKKFRKDRANHRHLQGREFKK